MLKKIISAPKKIFLRIQEKISFYFKKDLIIKANQYGRLGNNIQQFLLLVAHFKVFGVNFLDNEFLKSYEKSINFKTLPGFIDINNKSNGKIISEDFMENNMYLY